MSSNTPSWSEILERLLNGGNLSRLESTLLMRAWLDEELMPVQTGAFLAALRSKGLTGDELSSMATVLRDAVTLPCPVPEIPMVDTCGTGGDGAETFNISTAVAFVASACGANVAKHGNRSASGKVGSADVLESLDLQLKAPLELVVESISKVQVTFLFAPAWHPSLANLAPLRRALGVRTVFNLLGPLVNPLRPSAQVLGVAKAELLDPMAFALQSLGLHRAVVVHGAGGLDEASLDGENSLRLIQDGVVRQSNVDPKEMGLTNSSIQSLKGGDLCTNRQILISVLQGKGTQAQTEVVALNTALVLWAAGISDELVDGVTVALSAMKEGKPWQKLLDLKNALDNQTLE